MALFFNIVFLFPTFLISELCLFLCFQEALKGYGVVFDAVYTPMETRLLREAALEGATTVSGVEMFVGQAAQQFELFTGLKGNEFEAINLTFKQKILSICFYYFLLLAPWELMKEVVLKSLQK